MVQIKIQEAQAMAKFFNSVTGKMEDDGRSDLFDNILSGIVPNPVTTQAPIQQHAPQINHSVKEFLLKKIKPQVDELDSPNESENPTLPTLPVVSQKTSSVLDQFSPEKYKEALQQMRDKQSNLGLAQLAAGFGDALARRDSSNTDRYFQDLKGNIQDQTVGEFNRQKANAVNDIKTKQQIDALDPNSTQSQTFRKLVESTMPRIAQAYGDNWDKVTAADQGSILDFGKMRETIDARKAQYQMQQQLRGDAQAEKKLIALKDDLDPNKARGGNMAFNQKKVDQAERLEGLIKDSNGNINNLDSRQIEELAIGLNSMLSNSSSSAVSQVEALVPKTAMGNAQKLKEWLLNDPQGVNQVAFVKRMADTVEREKQIAGDQVKRAQVQRLSAHGNLARTNPDQYNQVLQAYGIDPKDIKDGQYKPQKQQSKIKVSNGKETLMIDPADLEHAQADGYKQVQ